MTMRRPIPIIVGLVLVSACSTETQEINYAIPEDLCPTDIGVSVPSEFFPPGEELTTSTRSGRGATAYCHASVDNTRFFIADISLNDDDIKDLVSFHSAQNDPPDAGAARTESVGDYEAHVWPNLAIAKHPCTTDYGAEENIVAVAELSDTIDVENSDELLEEYVLTALTELFPTIPYCQESDAYEGD